PLPSRAKQLLSALMARFQSLTYLMFPLIHRRHAVEIPADHTVALFGQRCEEFVLHLRDFVQQAQDFGFPIDRNRGRHGLFESYEGNEVVTATPPRRQVHDRPSMKISYIGPARSLAVRFVSSSAIA